MTTSTSMAWGLWARRIRAILVSKMARSSDGMDTRLKQCATPSAHTKLRTMGVLLGGYLRTGGMGAASNSRRRARSWAAYQGTRW